ncbi:MAG: glycosyltransferase family 4 protein [Verrucomicrobiales bacterium]|nr:glycosyltransferase family 4 protein [Verrucomicrobiales bacterium]
MPKRIWMLHHYGGPEGFGRFSRAAALANVLSGNGFQVRVFFASHHHLSPHVGSGDAADDSGAVFSAIPCRPYQGNGWSRIGNMRDFARGVERIANEVPEEERPDVVVASLPHPWVAVAAIRMKKRYGVKFVLEIRDIWPESVVQLGGVSSFHPFIQWVSFLIRSAYRNCDGLVSVLPGATPYFREQLSGRSGVKIAEIPNGVWVKKSKEGVELPLPEPHREAIERIRESGLVVIGYAGAMGPPNALRKLVDLQNWQKEQGVEIPYRILLVGSGSEKGLLEEAEQSSDDPVFRVLPRLEKSEVPAFLSRVDAALVLWNSVPVYQHGVSPNKVWEYFAVGKPVLWAGETGFDPVSQSGGGLAQAATDPAALHQLFVAFCENSREEREVMGSRGRRYVEEHGDWGKLGRAFSDFLSGIPAA